MDFQLNAFGDQERQVHGRIGSFIGWAGWDRPHPFHMTKAHLARKRRLIDFVCDMCDDVILLIFGTARLV